MRNKPNKPTDRILTDIQIDSIDALTPYSQADAEREFVEFITKDMWKGDKRLKKTKKSLTPVLPETESKRMSNSSISLPKDSQTETRLNKKKKPILRFPLGSTISDEIKKKLEEELRECELRQKRNEAEYKKKYGNGLPTDAET